MGVGAADGKAEERSVGGEDDVGTDDGNSLGLAVVGC